jgi:hypothetical protein
MASNREWPRGKETGGARRDPVGVFATPDGYFRSDRNLAGPPRTGTSADVGPRARGPVSGDKSYATDFGMDRISPRDFDPIGTTRNRFGDIPSDALTEQVGRRK